MLTHILCVWVDVRSERHWSCCVLTKGAVINSSQSQRNNVFIWGRRTSHPHRADLTSYGLVRLQMGQSRRSLCIATRCSQTHTSKFLLCIILFFLNHKKKASVTTTAFNSGCWPLTPGQIIQSGGKKNLFQYNSNTRRDGKLLVSFLGLCVKCFDAATRQLRLSLFAQVLKGKVYRPELLCWKWFCLSDTHTHSHMLTLHWLPFYFNLLKQNLIHSLYMHCPLILLFPRNLRALDFCCQNFVCMCYLRSLCFFLL